MQLLFLAIPEFQQKRKELKNRFEISNRRQLNVAIEYHITGATELQNKKNETSSLPKSHGIYNI